MTDPRWTIDSDGFLMWRDLHVVGALNEDNEDRYEAYDALKATVRDAETLTQARRLAATIRDLHAGGLRVHQVADYMRAKTALLDLLTGDGHDPA